MEIEIVSEPSSRKSTPQAGLTPTEHRAALMVAERAKHYFEIAEEIGIDVATLWRWRQRPDFARLVQRERRRLWAVQQAETVERREIKGRIERLRFLKDLQAEDARFMASLQAITGARR